MKNLRSSVALALGGLAVFGCAREETAEPASIPFAVSFPSSAAAIATDNVKIYVFDGAQRCNDLVRLRQTEQAFPARITETPSLTPCDLSVEGASTLELELRKDYTMLAVGQIAGADVFVGCTQQVQYGTTQALPIELSFIDDRQKLTAQTCVKLSDKCSGLCR